MKNILKIILLVLLICLPQVSYALQQPPVTPTPSLAKRALKMTDKVLGRGFMMLTLLRDSFGYALVKGLPLAMEKYPQETASIKSGLDFSEPSSCLQREVNKLSNKMGLKPVQIKTSPLVDQMMGVIHPNAAAVQPLNEVWTNTPFLQLPLAQQKAVMGHELSHIKFNDIEDRLIFDVASVATAVKGGNFLAKKLEGIKFPRFGRSPQVAATLLGSAVIQATASQLANKSYNRYQEKRADIHGILMTGQAQDFLDFFKEDTRENGSFKKKIKNVLLRPFATHPTHAQRIAYLKPYTQLQQVVPEREYNDLPVSC